MPKLGLHTIVILGLSSISIGTLKTLLNEHPLPLPCLLLQSKIPYACWPDYATSVVVAQEMACAVAAHYRAPLCIGIMHGVYGLSARLAPNTYSPAAVVEIAVRVEYGEIITTEVLLNPKGTAETLLGRQPAGNANAEEAACQLVDLLQRRQSSLA